MNETPSNLTRNWLDRLQQSGYRLTGPRRAIVEHMAASTCALEPADLFTRARRQYPGLGLVTVYRTLEKLEALGLIERVHQPGGCHGYLRALEGHQHLLLCSSCGQAAYFDGDELGGLFHRVAEETGYQVETDSHWLQLYGLCPACQENGK